MTGVPALPSRSLSQDLMRTSQLPVFMEYLKRDRLSVPGQIVRKSKPIVSVGKKYKGEALGLEEQGPLDGYHVSKIRLAVGPGTLRRNRSIPCIRLRDVSRGRFQ
jgi:hypothetical protein